MPSRENARVSAPVVWPTPAVMESSSEGNRVWGDVTSAITWSQDTVLCTRSPVWLRRAPVSQESAQTWPTPKAFG